MNRETKVVRIQEVGVRGRDTATQRAAKVKLLSDTVNAATTLSEADRAAVMVMLLDDDQAARILAELEPEELRLDRKSVV